MSTLRLWVIGAVLVSVIIIGLGYLLGVAPRLADAAAADSERQNVEVVNAGYEATLIELQQLADNLPALQAELDELRLGIPEDPQLSELLGQLNALAEAAEVEINDVTADPPVLFPAELLEGYAIEALVALPVRVSASGDSVALGEFLSAVQFGERLVLVEQFDIAEEASGRLNISGFVFVIPPEGTVLPSDEAGQTPPAEGEAPADAPAEEAPAEG